MEEDVKDIHVVTISTIYKDTVYKLVFNNYENARTVVDKIAKVQGKSGIGYDGFEDDYGYFIVLPNDCDDLIMTIQKGTDEEQ